MMRGFRSPGVCTENLPLVEQLGGVRDFPNICAKVIGPGHVIAVDGETWTAKRSMLEFAIRLEKLMGDA